MERTERGAVLAVDYEWSDLGTWESVLAAARRDGAGNAIDGAAIVLESEGCLIRGGEGARIIAIGLKDIAVVVEGGKVLVCDLAAAPSIKAAVKAVEEL
jgi:mannose-1-phosphate guanylyltransferase/mannose-6-phosphate isomerase